MSDTTSTAPQRYLPHQHADKDSTFFVPEELREDYARLQLDQNQRLELDTLARARAQAELDLQRWNTEYERIRSYKHNQPEKTQQWLKQFANPDGTPRLHLADRFDGPVFGMKAAPEAHHYTQAEHDIVLRTVQEARATRKRQESAERQRQALKRDRETCGICSAYPVPTEPLKGDSRMTRACADCTTLLPVVRALGSTGPDGTPRPDLVGAWLNKHPEQEHQSSDSTSGGAPSATAEQLRAIVARRRSRRGR